MVYPNFYHYQRYLKLIIYNRKIITTLISALFFSSLFSQKIYEPFKNEKVSKQYHIQLALDRPEIDGNLDDPVWSKISPITDFIQEDPENMAEPTEKTEVYLTYDDQSLYVAARLYDAEPSSIIKQLAPRDDWYGAFDIMADWFSIELDSQHDHQTGFSFAVNASGVISDDMIYNDADYDSDWNAIWQAEVKIDDFGWNIEMEIPFSNLPFFKEEKLTWGINITRFIQRKYETIKWVVFPIEIEGVVSKYGHVHGFKEIYPPAKFEIKPYSMGRFTNYSDIRLTDYDEGPYSHQLNYMDDYRKNIGLDIQYRINTNSQLTFTFNPDFGQIESDPAEVNLTAYETYFEEKRPFFLEDSDIFSMPIEIFYSRRIGEKDWGKGVTTYTDTLRENINANECTTLGGNFVHNVCIVPDTLYYDIPVTIKGAGKLTGKTQSGLAYGLMLAVSTLDDSTSWANQMMHGENKYEVVSRIKQDLFSGNSFIGFMHTSSLMDEKHVFSIDAMSNFLDNKIGIDGQIIIDQNKSQGIYGSLSFSPLGIFSGWINYIQFDQDLDINTLGYLWRENYSQTKLGFKLQSLQPWSVIRNASLILEGDMEENSQGIDLGKTIELGYAIQFSNFWDINGGIYKINEHYDDRKIIYDYSRNVFGPPIFIPEVRGSHINISSDKHKSVWTTFSWMWGSNTRNDHEIGQYMELSYKPNPYMVFSTSYDHYQLKKQYYWLESIPESMDSDTFHIFSDLDRKIDVLTLRASFNINRKLSIQGYWELFSNHDIFSSYSEYSPSSDTYDHSSDYIEGDGVWDGMPVYDMCETELECATVLDASYLDPNLYLGLYPKFTSLIFNGVIKWNYMKGSNIYIIYSTSKNVNGKIFNHINGLSDFIQFNQKESWTEILRDQSIMIKLDYWFEI